MTSAKIILSGKIVDYLMHEGHFHGGGPFYVAAHLHHLGVSVNTFFDMWSYRSKV